MVATAFAVFLATSVWDCPRIHQQHTALRGQFVEAMSRNDTNGMEDAARRGTQLVPEDPVWRYNLACSLARKGERAAALDALEKAVSLGYRNADDIAKDSDLKSVASDPRFAAAVETARRPWLGSDPLSPFESMPANCLAGQILAVGAQHVCWDFDIGAYVANVELPKPTSAEPYAGLAYVNLDRRHSMLNVYDFPGLVFLVPDEEALRRGVWQTYPDTLFPCPVFGNCSRSYTRGVNWRSLPRALMTAEAARLPFIHRAYLSNQVWVYPSCRDTDSSTNFFGDVCNSVAPYWIMTQGYSWSDVPYVQSALRATAAMKPETREAVVSRGMLAPTIQMLFRKSLRGVDGDADYLSPKAHPTAFPPNGLDGTRLMALAAAIEPDAVPPVAVVAGVGSLPVLEKSDVPEMVYATPCAWSFVLRSPDTLRKFVVQAKGGAEYAFAVVHGAEGAAKVEKMGADRAVVSLDRLKMDFTNRVDVAVFAKDAGTQWGAPSFVSFAVVDENAPYADPMLVVRKKPPEPADAGKSASAEGKKPE